jgi:FMN phosphatase YigB (HAD superfamily)
LKKTTVTLLLFDLDDTLLGNINKIFIPAYMQAMSARLSSVAEPPKFINILLAAIRQMMENLEPDQTLEEKFDAVFYPALGVMRRDVQGLFDAFYAKDYPKLRSLTQYKPDAVRVVQQVLARGDQAAIATNPLYPRNAILQRLDWAGLPVDKIPFALIPSYETFHYAKPNPAFYAEFMAQLGWPKIPVVMVGNDLDLDIGGARQLGMAVYWLNSDGRAGLNDQDAIPPHGEITNLIPWMEATPPASLPSNFNTPAALLAVLRATPAALATLIHQKPQNLAKRPAPNEWSPAEVLCHLRDVDTEVNLWRLHKVLNESNPFIPGQDTDRWAEIRRYQLQDGEQALADFTKARKEVLKLLENLNQDGWDRSARHAIFGPTTIRELVNIIAGHDILHVQQAYKAL